MNIGAPRSRNRSRQRSHTQQHTHTQAHHQHPKHHKEHAHKSSFHHGYDGGAGAYHKLMNAPKAIQESWQNTKRNHEGLVNAASAVGSATATVGGAVAGFTKSVGGGLLSLGAKALKAGVQTIHDSVNGNACNMQETDVGAMIEYPGYHYGRYDQNHHNSHGYTHNGHALQGPLTLGLLVHVLEFLIELGDYAEILQIRVHADPHNNHTFMTKEASDAMKAGHGHEPHQYAKNFYEIVKRQHSVPNIHKNLPSEYAHRPEIKKLETAQHNLVAAMHHGEARAATAMVCAEHSRLGAIVHEHVAMEVAKAENKMTPFMEDATDATSLYTKEPEDIVYTPYGGIYASPDSSNPWLQNAVSLRS